MSSRSILTPLIPLLRGIRTQSQSPLRFATSRLAIPRSQPATLAALPALQHRGAHTIPQPPAPTPSDSTTKSSVTSESLGLDTPPKSRVESQPHYRLSFTCAPCSARSTHNISKQGYHHGSVLVTCPSCRNRHVISDHLNIFGDKKVTIEDILREKGQLVKKGTLGEDGDIEFWVDEPAEATESK
ncbi:DNL zinc finger protein [Plectosphaerella plurivora]|uniref:DNL zinc finger protein n=1 Tax=Plectosphaerella plurivora TaxID=936078 RepID=A0A9P8VHR5_9PEZI|nr:DNL zinc finger protein [Plectosphaerella plurivora]